MKIKKIQKVQTDTPIKFYDVVDVEPYHNFLVLCNNDKLNDKNSFIISHNCSFMDEVDFTRGSIKAGDVLNTQNGIMQAYTTIKERINSRFIKNGVQYGRLFLVSSKKSEHDFIEAYVRKMENETDKMLVVDEPQWVIKPPGTFSKETFPVAVGNKSLKSRVLNVNITEEERKAIIKQGYDILDVPMNLRQSFILDVNTALMNLAGRSVAGATSFFNYDMFSQCYINNYKNPFTTEILTIGTKDALNISDFFKLTDVPDKVKYMPQFIHIDGSLNGDRTGISSVGVSGRKQTTQYIGAKEIISEELLYKHIFSVDIQAPQGSEISLEKTRQFIYYLKACGFNIIGISVDGYQSADTRQLLSAQGFDVSLLSLDKTPQGYMALRSAMNDKRIGLIQIDLLETELIQLQRDVQTGRIDHPSQGCFTGDTLIKLLDGRDIPIKDLINEKNLWTYGCLPNGKVIPVQIKKAFLTKYVDEIAEITLNNDKVIKCTPDHRFMLNNGEYKKAIELLNTDILMTFNSACNIKSIKCIKLDTSIPVYDMEIPETSNFLLTAGVFVHNSKDMSDSLAGALWNATLHKQDLMSSIDLIDSAIAINEDINEEDTIKDDLSNALLQNNMQSANNRLNELMNDMINYSDPDILSW